jgi:hypothetical protein
MNFNPENFINEKVNWLKKEIGNEMTLPPHPEALTVLFVQSL